MVPASVSASFPTVLCIAILIAMLFPREISSSDPIRDCKVMIIGGVGVQESLECCEAAGNSTCDLSQTLENSRENLKNGTLMNITSSVELHSDIKLPENLGLLTIIGHFRPTVNCTNGGVVEFSSCHNCTIEGIT